MTSTELLEIFIENSSDEDSMEKLIFLQDVSLCQGIITWKNMEINFIDTEIDFMGLSDKSWNRLWDYCQFDLDDFATVIGKKYSEAEDILKRLAFLKYIYPDGRVDKFALSYSRNVSKNMVSKLFSKSKSSKNEGDSKNENKKQKI